MSVKEMSSEMQSSVEQLQKLQKDGSRLQQTVEKYSSQLTENEVVQKELSLLEDDAKVFKLLGPVLVPQDIVEAKSNVDKRIEFINGELTRYNTSVAENTKSQDELKGKLMKLQTELQKAQQGGQGKKE
eukprot:m.1051357 g.1051357  ORF g.1051357 m.1051357 type:complete len:129 (+) comp24178_c0_seq6:135-521(+)